MKHLFLVASLVLAAPSAALACGGKPCDGGGCKMPPAGQPAGALPADGTHASIGVTGMKCGACAAKVKAAIDGVTGVKGSTVDATTGSAEVAFDAAVTDTTKIVAAINALGSYTAAAK